MVGKNNDVSFIRITDHFSVIIASSQNLTKADQTMEIDEICLDW